MKLDELAAARRTHKAFGPEPLSRETVLELLAVARLAPTHHLNQPWRFRILGPETLATCSEGQAASSSSWRTAFLYSTMTTVGAGAIEGDLDKIAREALGLE